MLKHAPPDLSARQLRAVLAVAEYRSFIAAATFLKISQPALTRIIQQVEHMLGVELFSRSTRQVATTPAGREFAALAERMLGELHIGVSNLRRQSGQQAGEIVVASVLSLAGAILPELRATFGRRYPGVQLHLREGLQSEVVEQVRAGTADFGIGYVEGVPATFIVDGVSEERFHVVVPAAHPLAARKRVAIRDLAHESLVSFPRESRSRQIADGAAATAGLTLRYAMTTNRLTTLLDLVRNGIGVAILTHGECPPAGEGLIARPLIGARFSCRLGVMRSRERDLTPAAAILLVVVQRWLRGLAVHDGEG